MEFTEKDASAFAKLSIGKKAQVLEIRCLLEKRSQHLMEQSALLKHDIDLYKNEFATMGIQDCLTGVTAHVCECSPLCPAIWSMLPEELLLLIFARLPLPNITRLRVLSKTLDRYVTKLYAERNPGMFALITGGYKYGGDNRPMVINVYDIKEKRWHCFVHETRLHLTFDPMFSSDGGLVCFVSTSLNKEMEIEVFNPLTRQRRELPSSSSLSRIQPCMVQLVMNRDSKGYRVLVVDSKIFEGSGGNKVAMIFSSVTGKWSNPNIFSDVIFGCVYKWRNRGIVGPCAYDCTNNTLVELNDVSVRNRYASRLGYNSVFVKGRRFVLNKNQHQCEFIYQTHISQNLVEYQAQICQPYWHQLNVHKCHQLDQLDDPYKEVFPLNTQIFGCQDFLVVNAYGVYEELLEEKTLLFDLSTCQWQEISHIPEWNPNDPQGDMFALRWDAVP